MRNKERPASKRLASGRGKEQEGDEDDREEQANSSGNFFSRFFSRFRRQSSRVGSMEEGDAMPGSSSSPDKEVMTEVCWKLSERGAVGETCH